MSGGCQAEHQPQLRCAQFDGKQTHKFFARGYGVVDDDMKRLLHNSDRPVRGFALQVLDALNASFPHLRHTLHNAAVDAWTAKAIEPCVLSNAHITTADLLLLELGSQGWHPGQAAASERIVRKLLTRTGGPPPALVLATTRQWCTGGTYGGSVHGLKKKETPKLDVKWEGIEDTFASFCKAYGVACLSLRDAIFRDVLASRPNFTVPDVAADCLHPEQSNFGYHYFADTIIHFLRKSWARYRRCASRRRAVRADAAAAAAARCQPRERRPDRVALLLARPARGTATNRRRAEKSVRHARLPQRRVQRRVHEHAERALGSGAAGRRAAVADTPSCAELRRCVLGVARRREDGACLRGRGHWQFCTHALAPRAPRKPGVVSVLPGAVMRLVVDTTAPVDANLTTAKLALTYLASYEGMGVCTVSCEGGCACAPRAIDALQVAAPAPPGGGRGARNVSVASDVEVAVSGAAACVVRLENTPRRGGSGPALLPAKWKLLQVRVGWALARVGNFSRQLHLNASCRLSVAREAKGRYAIAAVHRRATAMEPHFGTLSSRAASRPVRLVSQPREARAGSPRWRRRRSSRSVALANLSAPSASSFAQVGRRAPSSRADIAAFLKLAAQ